MRYATSLVMGALLCAFTVVTAEQPVRAQISVVQSAEDSSLFEVQIELQVAQGWYVHGSAANPEAGEYPLKFVIQSVQNVEVIGGFKSLQNRQGKEKLTGITRFRQKVRLKVPGTGVLFGVEMSFQACSAHMCNPPEALVLEILIPSKTLGR